MKKSVALALAFFSSACIADPSVFGMELNKMTESELKAKYNIHYEGINKFSNGNSYSVPASSIDFQGLKEVTTIFDDKRILVAVLTTLPKKKFDYLFQALNGKYTLVNKKIPFVGNKTATYQDGSTEITLSAPHMSFNMSMNYITKDFMKTYTQITEAESHQKQQKETSQL